MTRRKLRFVSGNTECAALHYPGSNGGCVITAGGGGVTKEPGTDPFAKRFHDAGFTAFDNRHLGGSGRQPSQIPPVRQQLADWQAALGFATSLPAVDPPKIAIWGSSLSGGHILRVAARNPQLAEAISRTPPADSLAAKRSGMRHQTPAAMLWLTGRGLLDAVGSLVGRQPLLVRLAGEPGTVAMLTTPDGIDGARALNPHNSCPDWQHADAARSALRVGSAAGHRMRTGSGGACSARHSWPGGVRPRGELVRLVGGHLTRMRSPTVRLAVGAATALALTILLALIHQRRADRAAAPAAHRHHPIEPAKEGNRSWNP